MHDNPKMQKAQKRMNSFFDKVGEEQDKRDQADKEKRRKVEGAASSSSSGQQLLQDAAQLALPGAEKRKSDLSEGEMSHERHEPPKKEPKVEDKQGTKR